MSQQKIYTKRKIAYNKRNLEHICHKTVNMAVSLLKLMKIPTLKGEHS